MEDTVETSVVEATVAAVDAEVTIDINLLNLTQILLNVLKFWLFYLYFQIKGFGHYKEVFVA